MDNPKNIEKKYLILFTILIIMTGFTFESQTDQLITPSAADKIQTIASNP